MLCREIIAASSDIRTKHGNAQRGQIVGVLSTFAELLLTTVHFVKCLTVTQSVRMEQLGYHWMDCREIWYLSTFRKSFEKIQVLLNSDKNKGYFFL